MHVDCKNAFLHGKSDVEIYITQPEGFLDREFPDKVLRLNKSLYGLKQASSYLVPIPLRSNHRTRIRSIRNRFLYLYSEEILLWKSMLTILKLLAPTMAKCETVYRELAQHVKVESKGPIKSFLGIDIIRNWNQHLIALNQGAYIDRLVAELGLPMLIQSLHPWKNHYLSLLQFLVKKCVIQSTINILLDLSIILQFYTS